MTLLEIYRKVTSFKLCLKKQPFTDNGVLKFRNIGRKTPVLESLFNNVAGLQVSKTGVFL